MPLIASRMTAPIITPSMKLIPLPFVVSSQYRIYAQEMDSSEKTIIGILNFREFLRPFLEPGRSVLFPGASRMIREVSHV